MYNPTSVPSIVVGGWRRPICRRCLDHVVNPARLGAGLDPIVPLPDAYEPCDESELELE